MRILITNDDGIDSLGIRALIEVLHEDNELYVVAPDRERSATGHSLTLHKPLRIQSVDAGVPNTTSWQSTGTPTDCIKLALCSLLMDKGLDLVITGINHGPNLGADILYSGTVNAAIEGAIYSIPSIAISLTDGHHNDTNFKKAALFLKLFLKELPQLNLPPQTVLNINFPPSAEPKLSNVKIAELGKRMYSDCYEKRVDPRGKVYYWLSGDPIEEGEDPDSDVMAIAGGCISVTPIQFNLTDLKLVGSLRKHFN